MRKKSVHNWSQVDIDVVEFGLHGTDSLADSAAIRISSLPFRLQVLQPVALTSTVPAQDCSTFLSWVANTPLNH